MSKNDADKKCSEHQGLVISCSKIDEIHENVLEFRRELREAMEKAFEKENQIIALRTSKEERWKVQGWYNKSIIGLITGVFVTLGYEWLKFHGGK